MQLRWGAVFAALVVAILIVGCGRVNLEDLTPEAVRTELASRPTPTPRPTVNTTPGATQPSGGGAGDLDAGRALYTNWCTGCHDTGRLDAPVIRGNTYDVAEWIPILRDPGDKTKHPTTYRATELDDNNWEDVFAYIASAP